MNNNTVFSNTKLLKRRKENRIGSRKASVAVFIVLVLMALVILLPFYMVVITSLKDNAESASPVFTWWPKMGIHFDGYKRILFNDVSGGAKQYSMILNGFKNTFIIVIPTTLVGLFMSSLSAYAFAKLRFPGKKLAFNILLLTMMIPGIIMLTPSYLMYDTLGLVNTFVPLMLPGMFGGASCVFFMRQYFYSIPSELVESAKIDGLNSFSIFIKIMIPLSVSGLIAQGVLGFVGGYNDYMGPLIYLQTPDKYTLQIALRMSLSTYGSDWQTVMAGAVLALIPTTVLYVVAQRFFIEGIATTGLKA